MRRLECNCDCLFSIRRVVFRPHGKRGGQVIRKPSGKFVLVWMAILGAGLVAGKLDSAARHDPLRALATPDKAEPPVLDPAVYHHVAQVIWVVSDIDRVVDYWQRLGIRNIQRDGVVSFPDLTYRGQPDPATAKRVTANVGDLEIQWIQPQHGGKFWRRALRERGDGIRVLAYAVRSPQEFDDQIKYFSARGVGPVVQDSWPGPAGRGRVAYLDTAEQGGGHTLALIDDPSLPSRKIAGADNEYPLTKITHFAWVVNDVRRVDAYYTGLGFPPFSSIDHNVSLERMYRGQPGTYEMWLGWDRTGTAAFEWVQQITGPDVYVEYGKKHGEGFHHLGVNVTDMDEAIKQMTARGAPPSQAAAWKTRNGRGRAVYLDSEPYGGVTLELIYDPR
jgi:methylmalonyl-CoA/ethylmalonyl-CoA epimerase